MDDSEYVAVGLKLNEDVEEGVYVDDRVVLDDGDNTGEYVIDGVNFAVGVPDGV